MKIDREEKRSLKKLLVGILVAAMVVTMLPVGDTGKIEVEAAESSSLQQISPFNESTKVVLVTTIDDFLNVLSGNFLTKTELETYDYSNGVIIKLGANIDFLVDTGEVIEYNGINIPSFPVGIDMGEYNLTNISYLSYEGEQSVTMSEGYSYNLLVRGNGSNVFSFYPQKGDFGDEQNNCSLDNQMQVVFSGVNVENVLISVNPGSAFGYDNYYYELPNDEGDGSDWIQVVYDSKMGIGVYRTSGSVGDTQAEIYVDELHVKDGVSTIDVTNAMGSYQTYNYTEGAVASIPAGVTLTYKNPYYIMECPNPGSEFRVDNRYGLYTLSEDGKTMTVYAIYSGGQTLNRHDIAGFSTMSSETGEETVLLEIYGNFYAEVEQDNQIVEIPCETVYFTQSAIPTEVVEEVWSEEGNTEVSYPLTEVFICETAYQFFSKTHFVFDASQHTELNIYNEPDLVKASFSGGAEQNKIWSGVIQDAVLQKENLEETENELKQYQAQQTQFGEMGTPYVVKLKPGYTISNIQFGGFANGETGYDYANGYRAEASCIVPYPDGTVEFIIPGFTSAIDFTVDPIQEIESLSGVNDTALIKDGQTYWYNKELSISMEGYEVYDVTINKEGEVATSIMETEEGIHEKEYYFINKTLDNDGVSPSSEYGKIVSFKHNYVLDLATPTITSVTATDANGNAMTLDGGWLGEYDTVSAETVWTNTSSITLKATANAGSGLPVAGYMFDGENWQTSNTYTYTGDGVYDVAIHARDEFDVKLEAANKTRPEAGIWVSSVGIDTTAPKLMFTDGTNATASELKSNAQYEGNLHVVCDDGEGSGFASINLYKKNGSEWTLSNELLIATEDASFIAPTTQNEVYKLEVTDIAGNTNVYENITVVGYVQDVEITVGDVTGVYGEDLEIEVTVKNISENPLSISAFGLREDATDDVFEMEANVVTELASGESFTTKILVAKGANAGDYTAMLDMEYINMDADAGQRVSKVNSQQITATIEKAEGAASVSVEDITYGQTPKAIVESTTNGTENVTIYYRPAAAEDSEYTTEAPANAGEYKVKAVFAATANYNEVEATAEFTIAKAAGTGTVSVENLYYGQTISTTVSSDTNGTDNVTVYFKRAEEDDSTYTTEAPRRVGTYKVKAVFAETANYTELVVEGEFTITRISETRGMYSISSPNRDGVYEGPVVITGMDGNLVSVSEQNGFKEQIVLNGSIEFFRFFIKTPDGAITEAVILRNIVIKEPPVKVTAGRAHLDTGAAYELGEGTWNVSGDSTNYVGGTVFYVPESGDYEFTQQEGGQ